jgi:hypothetical protein
MDALVRTPLPSVLSEALPNSRAPSLRGRDQAAGLARPPGRRRGPAQDPAGVRGLSHRQCALQLLTPLGSRRAGVLVHRRDSPSGGRAILGIRAREISQRWRMRDRSLEGRRRTEDDAARSVYEPSKRAERIAGPVERSVENANGRRPSRSTLSRNSARAFSTAGR